MYNSGALSTFTQLCNQQSLLELSHHSKQKACTHEAAAFLCSFLSFFCWEHLNCHYGYGYGFGKDCDTCLMRKVLTKQLQVSFGSWDENFYKQAFKTQGLKLTVKINYDFPK